MWLGQRAGSRTPRNLSGAGSGDVTIADMEPAVMLENEKRQLPPVFPGCYFWRPEAEDEAMVMRGSDGLRYVIGLLGQEKKLDCALMPGEAALIGRAGKILMLSDMIKIEADGCCIEIKDDSVSIQGKLFLNGTDVGAALASITEGAE